jgi:hypothetical protein
MIFRKLESSKKDKIGPTPHVIHQNKSQMDKKCKCKNKTRQALEANIVEFLCSLGTERPFLTMIQNPYTIGIYR